MDLQHWSIINLEMVNWEIYLVNNLSTLLSLQNFQTRYLNYSPSLYSTPPHFLNFQTGHKRKEKAIDLKIIKHHACEWIFLITI